MHSFFRQTPDPHECQQWVQFNLPASIEANFKFMCQQNYKYFKHTLIYSCCRLASPYICCLFTVWLVCFSLSLSKRNKNNIIKTECVTRIVLVSAPSRKLRDRKRAHTRNARTYESEHRWLILIHIRWMHVRFIALIIGKLATNKYEPENRKKNEKKISHDYYDFEMKVLLLHTIYTDERRWTTTITKISYKQEKEVEYNNVMWLSMMIFCLLAIFCRRLPSRVEGRSHYYYCYCLSEIFCSKIPWLWLTYLICSKCGFTVIFVISVCC